MKSKQDYCLFTTNGMFIIDKIVNKTKNTIDIDVPGGGGLFSTLGSTIVATSENNLLRHNSPNLSKTIKFIIDCGKDFPNEIIKPMLDPWNVDVVYRYDESRLTTRGYNEYDGDYRIFRYETPKLQIIADDILSLSKKEIGMIHLICSPKRCHEILQGLKIDNGLYKCYNFVWEPTPDMCKLEYLADILSILQFYNQKKGFNMTFSPNSEEFLQLITGELVIDPSLDLIKKVFFKNFEKLFFNHNHKYVIRCGKLGCLLYNNKLKKFTKYPAYHDDTTKDKIVDATGCGNSFIGAYATALVLTDFDYEIGCIFGNIASGIVLEQKGLPTLSKDSKMVPIWNKISFNERLDIYKNKL
ncbi:hypothetical protein QEN19_003467 [Hanseniaspora menglaensis]